MNPETLFCIESLRELTIDDTIPAESLLKHIERTYGLVSTYRLAANRKDAVLKQLEEIAQKLCLRIKPRNVKKAELIQQCIHAHRALSVMRMYVRCYTHEVPLQLQQR